ncbi:Transmembrane amino acid transporter family protein [Zea mays]|nr:Transmembrane amino acid transporter family protein [Zea mays]
MIVLAVVTSSIAIASNIMSSISDEDRGGHVAGRR